MMKPSRISFWRPHMSSHPGLRMSHLSSLERVVTLVPRTLNPQNVRPKRGTEASNGAHSCVQTTVRITPDTFACNKSRCYVARLDYVRTKSSQVLRLEYGTTNQNNQHRPQTRHNSQQHEVEPLALTTHPSPTRPSFSKKGIGRNCKDN